HGQRRRDARRQVAPGDGRRGRRARARGLHEGADRPPGPGRAALRPGADGRPHTDHDRGRRRGAGPQARRERRASPRGSARSGTTGTRTSQRREGASEMNAKKTPLMVVNDEHGGKTKLVDKIMGLIERDEDEDKDSLKARL